MNPDNHSREINSTKDLTHGSYIECMTRAFLGGLSTFTIVFSGAFFGQRVIIRKFSSYSCSKKTILLAATVPASLISYYVISRQIKDCKKSLETNE